ncbi:hypothetical protein [Pseudocitrobacter faecalis]
MNTNVAAKGAADTDAVNVAQLNQRRRIH